MMNSDHLNKLLNEVSCKVENTAKNAVAQRKLAKLGYSFSELPLPEQLIVWDYIWNNAVDPWTRIHSFFYLESHMNDRKFLVDTWEIIQHWQTKVDDWGSSDALAKIYTKILEIIPENVLELIEQWNKSENLWDRRQSLVSLLYFSRTKRVVLPFNTIIPFINALLEDREYYVQKAVGWSLKELYQVYPEETMQYLNENSKRISATAFVAATEKLSSGDKNRLKAKRKSDRL